VTDPSEHSVDTDVDDVPDDDPEDW
jgi:hypothetical protein